MINKSDLRRQVAELFIVRASGFNLDSQRLYPNLEESNSNLKRLLEEGVGGVIVLGGTVKELEIRCNILKKWSGKPLLLCADICLLYTSPSPRDKRQSRMPSSA